MSGWTFRVAYVPPSQFFPPGARRYWRPRRITLSIPERPAVYRWLVWNVTLRHSRPVREECE